MRCAFAVLLCLAAPRATLAQEDAILPRNDTMVTIGWTGSERTIHDYGRWDSRVLVGASAGRYWTPNLKTEIDVNWQSSAAGVSHGAHETAQGQTFAAWEYRIHERRAGLTQIYQFGRNAWVHPFVGAGADFVWGDIQLVRRAQRQFISSGSRVSPVDVPEASEARRISAVEPHVKTGLKMYFRDRTFAATTFELGFSHGVSHVAWRLGLGFDY